MKSTHNYLQPGMELELLIVKLKLKIFVAADDKGGQVANYLILVYCWVVL